MRVELGDRLHRLETVPALADDLEPLLAAEVLDEDRARGVLVVDHQHAQGLARRGCRHRRRHRGRRRRGRVGIVEAHAGGPQVGQEVADARVALRRILRQAALDHPLDLGHGAGEAGARQARRRLLQHRVQRLDARLAPERADAGEHLEQDGAEREDVAARVDAVPRAPARATCRRRCR